MPQRESVLLAILGEYMLAADSASPELLLSQMLDPSLPGGGHIEVVGETEDGERLLALTPKFTKDFGDALREWDPTPDDASTFAERD